MAKKSKRIKGKLLQEAMTPADVPDSKVGDAFYKLTGNRHYHSLQVWREDKDSSPTFIYGLTLPQLSAVLSDSGERKAAAKNEAATAPIVLDPQQDLSTKLDQLQEKSRELTEENRKHRADKNLQMQIFNRLTHILPGGLRAIQRAIQEANSPNFYPDDLPPEKAKSIKAILYPSNGSQKWKRGR